MKEEKKDERRCKSQQSAGVNYSCLTDTRLKDQPWLWCAPCTEAGCAQKLAAVMGSSGYCGTYLMNEQTFERLIVTADPTADTLTVVRGSGYLIS